MYPYATGYTGRDYGSNLRQQQEMDEVCGLFDPDEHYGSPSTGFEEDNRADLERERRGQDGAW